ncbi:MAG: GAF domain-containing protein [bacterium]|nr:GAF domain-containing protein [bacterium]
MLVPLAGIAPNALIQVVNSGQYVLLEPWQMDQMPLALREVLQPETAVILMPLLVRDRVIGIIAADNRYTRVPISSELIELLAIFAGAAAIAIDKTRLLLETRLAQKRLHAFYEGSQSLVSTTEPEIVLQQIADKAREVALAEWVALILIDANGYMQRAVHSYEPGLITPTGTIRPTGLSQTIMATGQDIIIHNLSETHLSVSPSTLERGIQAAAGFPISVRGRRIGVMWIHYRIPHHFTNAEQEALKLFVNQAALAYENTIRFRDLDNLRQAAQRLAAATSRQHVLAEIVDTACTVLEADSAAIWLFDASRDQFLLQDWRAASDDDRLIWEQLQENVPSPGGMAYQIMEMDWIGIDAVADHTRYEFLSPSTSEFLQRLDVNSFQGVALAVGNEKLGVLYINYHQRRSFSTEDRNMTRNFAVQASLALKKAILLDGFRSARDAAQVVARMTTLESLDKTLESVLTGTKEALNCDAITLHIYDSQHEVMESQPYMMGVQDAAAATRLPKIPPHSITYQILERESYYIADNTAQDPLFRNRPFVLREKIATCVALPLRVGAEKVGVLFINYRTHHLLTGDDLGNINLFGNQAAIAIYNAQLFQREQNRTRALEAMYNAGRTVAVSLNLDKILTQIVQQAWYLVRYQQKQASYASIWRVIDDTHAELVATYPTEAKTSTVNRVGNVINWRTGKNGRIGIIGRVIHTGVTVLAADVLQDRDYLETQPSTRSEVAVPILINGQVMGVINLEHESVDAFQKENVAALESLATQAAIAIRNSTLFDITVKHARLLGAAAKVASQAITILDEDELLREAVALITDQLDFYHAAVFLLDDEEETAWLRAAASPAADVMLAELYHLPVGVGVVGTVAQTGRPYLVSDIRQDTHHLFNPHLPHTQSEMAFPLVARGKVIGVLDVQSQQRIPISPEEEAALQTMANQLANAVQNARYYAQVLRRADNLQAVQVAGQAISGSLEQETVLNNIVEQAWRLTGTHGPEAQLSCLALINEDRQSLEFVAAYPGNVLPQLKRLSDISTSLTSNGLASWAALTNKKNRSWWPTCGTIPTISPTTAPLYLN